VADTSIIRSAHPPPPAPVFANVGRMGSYRSIRGRRRLAWLTPLVPLLMVTGCTHPSSSTKSGAEAASSRPQGSSSSQPQADDAGAEVVRVTAGPKLEFTPKTLHVKKGPIRLILTVVGTQPQNLTIPQLGVSSGAVSPGKPREINIAIPHAGKFTFFSAYHRLQGMTGTILAS
jgi:plastocyanin